MLCIMEYFAAIPGVAAILAVLVGYGILKEKVSQNEKDVEGMKSKCEKLRNECQIAVKGSIDELKKTVLAQSDKVSRISESVVRIETKLELISNGGKIPKKDIG